MRRLLPVALFAAALPALSWAGAPEENAAFLAKNAGATGVMSLPAIQYRVLKSGPANGPSPTRASTIKVRYEGRFLTGEMFDSSADEPDGAATFPLGRLIPGWVTLLQLMKPGDIWEAWLPPQFAYGAKGKETIPPDSVLMFRIELVAVE